MTLRCNPGDLAVIVETYHPDLRHLIGKLVIVTRPAAPDFYGDPCWKYKGARLRCGELICESVPDKWLRPIRPGAAEYETPTEIIRALSEGITA